MIYTTQGSIVSSYDVADHLFDHFVYFNAPLPTGLNKKLCRRLLRLTARI